MYGATGKSESVKGAVETGIGVSILSKTTIEKELELKDYLTCHLAQNLQGILFCEKKT